MRCSSLLAYMLLHVEVPAVIRLAIKCAKVFFKLVDLRKLKLFYSESGAEKTLQDLQGGKEQRDFLTEAFRTIGAKITNSCDLPDSSAATQPSPRALPAAAPVRSMESMLRETEEEKKAEPEEEEKEVEPAATEQTDPSASLEKKPSAVKPETQAEEKKPAKTEREYVVYANVNIPREEDFIFLVTALWHWYSKHTPSGLSLYSSPDEMEVKQVPPPEEKPMATEASTASLNMEQLEAAMGVAGAPGEEEKKADAPEEGEKKEPAKEEEKKEEAPKEEDKKEPESKEAEKEKPAEA